MKKLLIVLFLFTSCKVLNYIPKEESIYGLNFTKYSEQGFLITPEKYLGDYESIGIFNYTFVPSASIFIEKKVMSSGILRERKIWLKENYSIYDGLDSLYNFSKSIGADAIINFQFNIVTRNYTYGYENPVTLEGFELSGFAIKRKD